MAKTYRSYLTGDMAKFVSRDCQPMTAACGRDIPVGTATGLGVQIPVSAPGVSRIEAVQVSLKLGHIRPGDLAVELISPAGTRSVLMNAYSLLAQDPTDVESYLLASYAFNEEPSNGIWTLRLIDVGKRDNAQPGRFQAAQLVVMGH